MTLCHFALIRCFFFFFWLLLLQYKLLTYCLTKCFFLCHWYIRQYADYLKNVFHPQGTFFNQWSMTQTFLKITLRFLKAFWMFHSEQNIIWVFNVLYLHSSNTLFPMLLCKDFLEFGCEFVVFYLQQVRHDVKMKTLNTSFMNCMRIDRL